MYFCNVIELRVETIDFIKTHGKLITNVLVVLLVILAVCSKLQDNGIDSLFRLTDLYILAGALLGLGVIRLISKRHK